MPRSTSRIPLLLLLCFAWTASACGQPAGTLSPPPQSESQRSVEPSGATESSATAPAGTDRPTDQSAGQAGSPAADEKPALPRIRVTDLETLRRNVGKTVTVYGQVSRTGKSSSGINFLNFANTELTIVCLRDDAAKFKDGQPADQYRDAEIEVTGEVQRFKGKLQVALTAPQHIRRIEADQPELPSIELQQVGTDHWRSPAGLNYKGRDPDGRTRLDHVLRHAKDDPRRDGPHGVFDGGRDGALSLIDQAWQQIQKQRVRPDIEGSRDAYTVRFPRKVGYLGGRAGASRRHPALYRVLIVVERDTSNVVTAYPK